MSDDYHFEIEFCQSILKRNPSEVSAMEMLAGYLTKVGKIDEGLAWDQKIVELAPENAISHYNLACSLALKNHALEAIEALQTAMEKGYRDFSWLVEDPDLENLHQHPAFSALLSKYKINLK